MRLLRRGGFVALGFFVTMAVALPVAYVLDARSHDGRVARNVQLAGTPIGGLTKAQLEHVVQRVATKLATATIVVDAPKGGFSSDAKAMGVDLAAVETVEDALEVGRGGDVVGRVTGWVGALVRPRAAPVRVTVRPAAVYDAVDAKDKGPRTPPVEPTITFEKGSFKAVPGKPGKGIDPADVIAGIPDAAAKGIPIHVEVDRGTVAPRYRIDEAEVVARKAQTAATKPIDVTAGDAKATVPVGTIRQWLRAEPEGDTLSLAVDDTKVLADLKKLLPGAGKPAKDTTFEVVGGEIRIVPGTPGTACCADTATGTVEQAIVGGARTAVRLPLARVDPELTPEEAAELGVKEPVGAFTTRHPSGQPRVRNIHRIADLIRGQVIEPGKTFSVNGFVGKRTPEKGFVSAGVIEDGKFTEDIGGGISQFATTLFNAAFFAGLDLVEYQSHSLVIDRYPYGREATLSYPKPDLKIKNNTPHGVLIWPSYTGSTITVTLYSTKFVTGDQTGQSSAPKGPCTRVVTERTRTYVADGRKEKDRVTALYRPAEGINC